MVEATAVADDDEDGGGGGRKRIVKVAHFS